MTSRIALFLPAITLLAACEPAQAPAPANPSDFAFMGSWNCGVTVMTFMPASYLSSNDADPIPVTQFRRMAAGATEITLSDGAKMVVQNVTDMTMNWLSLQTGDSFDCTRVAG